MVFLCTSQYTLFLSSDVSHSNKMNKSISVGGAFIHFKVAALLYKKEVLLSFLMYGCDKLLSMKKIILSFVLLFISPVAWSVPDVFTVSDVEVSLVGASVSPKTREKAIKKASWEGFDRLLKRMTVRSYWHLHQDVIDQSDIDALTKRVSLVEESVENGRYYLKAHVVFNRDVVRDLLKKNRMPFSENRGGKLLTFAVYQPEDKANSLLWESGNLWRQVLSKKQDESGFFDLVFPRGDMSEVTQITPEVAMLGASDILLRIAENYDATQVVVASVRIENTPFSGRVADVEGRVFGESNEWPLYVRLNYPEEMTENQILAQAASAFYTRLGEQSQSDTLVDVNRPDRVYLRYRPASLSAHESMQSRIQSLSTVKDFNVRVMHVHDMVFQVDFYGTREKFKQQLETRNIQVVETSRPMVWGLLDR